MRTRAAMFMRVDPGPSRRDRVRWPRRETASLLPPFAHRHFLAADVGDIGAANEQCHDDEGDQQEDAGNEKYRRTRRLSEFGEEGKVGLCRVASQGHG